MTQTPPVPTGEREVTLVRGEERRTGMLRWRRVPETNHYRVELAGPEGELEAEDRDLFEALNTIRRELEPKGWLIAVQGSRADTYPTGMVRDMLGARRVYVLKPGAQAAKQDLVNIFDDADPAALTTVDQQRLNYQQWRESLRG